jgi:ABC-type bacteriocin/lantibiotic exporter with double-glycine peptidase domain
VSSVDTYQTIANSHIGPSGLWGVTLSLLIYPPAYILSRWQYRIFKAFVAVGDKRVSLLQEAIQTMSMIKMTASEAFWYKRLDKVRQEEFRLQLRSRLVSTASGLL